MARPAIAEAVGAKAERTRATILAAAEDLFSRQGFGATRLEDVADAVHLTRAALFYYFKDKQSLYDAMIDNAFAQLTESLGEVLSAPGRSISQRIERATEAWVEAIAARPTLARLILRYVADVPAEPAHMLGSDTNSTILKFWALFEEGRRSGELKPLHDNPFHVASAVIGSTVFYVSALGALVPQGSFQPLNRQQLDAHKREAVFATRHYLGIRNTGE